MNIYRGDIFYVDWAENNAPVGSEQRPGRPAVVVSNNDNNMELNTVQVVYLTTAEKMPRPSRVRVMCKVPSTALCEQITTVAQERLGTYVRSCTAAEMAAIDNAIMATLALEGVTREESDAMKAHIGMLECDLQKAAKVNAELEETKENLLAALETLKGSNAVLNASLDAYKAIHTQMIDKLLKKGDV